MELHDALFFNLLQDSFDLDIKTVLKLTRRNQLRQGDRNYIQLHSTRLQKLTISSTEEAV